MKIICCMITICLLCRHIMSSSLKQETYRISDTVALCSTWLSTIIENICSSKIKIVKRDTSLILDKLTPKSMRETVNKERLMTSIRWRRVRRQVASECCEHPCTIATIIMYCPDDSEVLQENPDLFN